MPKKTASTKKSDKTQITFDKVSKVYADDFHALHDVTFKIDKGEFLFVVGPSGAGKSTIIRLLTNEERPTSGEIFFEDIDVPTIPRKMLALYRQQLGVVFQDLKLIPSKTVEENIQFALEISRKPKDEIQDTTDKLLNLVGLTTLRSMFPETLSGGEMQKTAIARALANEPKLFIADEPTGNLDPDTSMEILEILKEVNSWGTTVMVISHDQSIVDKMKTRVLRLESGKLKRDGKGKYKDKK